MTWLPIVGRELRVASRRAATYWLRVGSALVGLLGAGFIYAAAVAQRQSASTIGQATFMGVAWLGLIHSLLVGIRLTADCVSEEKREGTLGLLFLTDLKGYDVALGKLAACSLNSLYGLMALAPILGIPLLMGGVSFRQFASVVLVLLNTLLLSLSVGLLCSTLARNGRNAAGATVLILMLVAALPPVVAIARAAARQGLFIEEAIMYPSPGYALFVATMPALPTVPGLTMQGYWTSLGMTAAMWSGCLILTSLMLPRVWKDKPASLFKERLARRWQRWAYGTSQQRRMFRARMLEKGPFYWLAARDRLKPTYVWTFLALAGCAYFYGFLYHPDPVRESGFHAMVTLFVHGVLKLWIAVAVVKRLAEDRRSTALELILCTPLSVRAILVGQLRALWRQFGPPIILVVISDIVACWAEIRMGYPGDADLKAGLYAAHIVMLLADFYVLAWLGMWVALNARHPNQAGATTLALIVVPHWGLFMCLTILCAILSDVYHWRLDISEGAALGVWFALGLVTDIFLLAFAVTRLKTRFRLAVTRRFDRPRFGWMRRFLGA